MSTRSLSIVVLTCGGLGYEVALAISALDGVRRVDVLRGPYFQKKHPFPRNLMRAYQMVGAAGLSRSIIRKVSGIGAGTTTGNDAPDLWRKRAIDAGIGSFEVEDFNSPEGIAAIAAVGADLGVVAGTYILKRPAFSVPRLGCINLHSGKVPDYRGAAPAFWELYNGETHVGITIHKVEERLDAGNIITSDQFQLDWMPGLDPVQFIEDYRARILRPNGVRLMADAVTAIVQGKCEGQAVVLNGTKAYRTPTFKDICELRRRVKERAERIDT